MPNLSTLTVPVKEGSTVTVRSLALGTTIKKLTLPVKIGNTVTNVTYDLPDGGGGGDLSIVVGVNVFPPTLYGETCVCTDSLGATVDSKVVDENGWAIFALSNTGTYTFTINF